MPVAVFRLTFLFSGLVFPDREIALKFTSAAAFETTTMTTRANDHSHAAREL
jgi:hypothetical protein